MKLKKLTAFLTAVLVGCSVTSCSLRNWSDSSDASRSTSSEKEKKSSKKSDSSRDKDENKKSDITTANFNPIKDSERLDVIRDHVNALLDDMADDADEDDIQDDIDTLLNDFDVFYEEYNNLSIPYYLDMDNEELEADADDVYEDLYIASGMINYAFCKGVKIDKYSHLFENMLFDDEMIESFSDPSLSLKRLEGYSRVENWIRDDQIDRFHDIAYDDDMKDKEKNLKCAEILMEILQDYDTERLYIQYSRDYTGDEILELSDTVKEELIPAADEILKSIRKMDNGMEIVYDPVEFDDPFETLAQYAPLLSSEIGKAAEQLIEDEAYSISYGDGSYNGSFTMYLPVSKKGTIYITDNNDYYSLLTPVHEFGHYYAMNYDHIPTFLAASNMDIAEIQSQGFECIFTRFYDDIYGDQADAMLAAKTYDLANSVISGFAVGEFEYTVLKNLDTLTPEDVVDLWDEIAGDSLPGIELYMVNHIFESPGYYISYAVSALAAFDIWKDCFDSPDKALKKYQNIAEISSNDHNYAFRSATKKAGFDDVLNKKYISELADILTDYAEDLR